MQRIINNLFVTQVSCWQGLSLLCHDTFYRCFCSSPGRVLHHHGELILLCGAGLPEFFYVKGHLSWETQSSSLKGAGGILQHRATGQGEELQYAENSWKNPQPATVTPLIQPVLACSLSFSHET